MFRKANLALLQERPHRLHPFNPGITVMAKNKTSHIESLIARGEGQHLDFKFAVNDSRKIARSMAAFANSGGGTLLIGVKDNGVISGVRTVEEFHMVETAAGFFVRPAVVFKSREWDCAGKKVLEVIIPEGKERPYYAKGDDGRWLAWLRWADTDLLAPGVWLDYARRLADAQGVVIQYGLEEKILLRLFETKGLVTLEEYSTLTGLSHKAAGRIIADFMLMDIASLRYVDGIPYFCLKPGGSSL